MAETTLKPHAFAFIFPFSNMYLETRLRLRWRYFQCSIHKANVMLFFF